MKDKTVHYDYERDWKSRSLCSGEKNRTSNEGTGPKRNQWARKDLLPSSTRVANNRTRSGDPLEHLGVLGTLNGDLDTIHIEFAPVTLIREPR